ncbi:MAG: stress response translation initiation inhibitor YciH, partial [Pseudomonadales bacterium]
MKKGRGGLVYSTDAGRICPGCRRPVDECVCRDRSRPREGDGAVIVARET